MVMVWKRVRISFFFKSFPPNFIFPPVAQGVGGGVPAGTGIGGEEGKNFFFSMFLSKFIHTNSSCSHYGLF